VTTHRLLVDCRDEPGLIHRIAGVVFRAGFDITKHDEYVERAALLHAHGVRLSQRLRPIGDQIGAVDAAGQAGGQEQHRRRDLVGMARAA
jgi:formyltetrahydrofolate hydrolase